MLCPVRITVVSNVVVVNGRIVKASAPQISDVLLPGGLVSSCLRQVRLHASQLLPRVLQLRFKPLPLRKDAVHFADGGNPLLAERLALFGGHGGFFASGRDLALHLLLRLAHPLQADFRFSVLNSQSIQPRLHVVHLLLKQTELRLRRSVLFFRVLEGQMLQLDLVQPNPALHFFALAHAVHAWLHRCELVPELVDVPLDRAFVAGFLHLLVKCFSGCREAQQSGW